MKWYVLGPASAPDYASQPCLVGPFATQQEALQAAQSRRTTEKFTNWTVISSELELKPGDQLPLPPEAIKWFKQGNNS